MSNKTLRVTLRWIHIIGSSFIGTYVYSPWSSNPTFAALTKFVVIPVLGLTGLGMWQQARLVRLFKGNLDQVADQPNSNT